MKAPAEFIEPAEEREFTLEAFETLTEIELNRKTLQFFQFILSLWVLLFIKSLAVSSEVCSLCGYNRTSVSVCLIVRL